jgi:ABC-type sugar transport system ATPase subunit
VFQNISFKAHEGEIVGFAGLMGAGRSEVMESIFGLHSYTSGSIKVNGANVSITKPADAIKHGLAFITEDRKQTGLNLKGSVKKNITLSSLKNYCAFQQVIKPGKENVEADRQIKNLRVKSSGRHQLVNTLSGGNQQKIVLAKWFLTNPHILILDEPTRGIDVGAKAEIYKLISQLVINKKTVLLISSEMPELLGLCDRIIVLNKGKISAEFKRDEFSQESIMKAAMKPDNEIQFK